VRNREHERGIYAPVIQIKQHKKSNGEKIDISTSVVVLKPINVTEHEHIMKYREQ
jgi:hypothetical protein